MSWQGFMEQVCYNRRGYCTVKKFVAVCWNYLVSTLYVRLQLYGIRPLSGTRIRKAPEIMERQAPQRAGNLLTGKVSKHKLCFWFELGRGYPTVGWAASNSLVGRCPISADEAVFGRTVTLAVGRMLPTDSPP